MQYGLMVVAMLVGQASAQEDPTGFVAMLNAERAARGLSPVAYSESAVGVAAENNRLQAVRGLGHHYTGGLGQVAAVGAWDARTALRLWMASAPHSALLFAPNLVRVGFHAMGGVATASTEQSFVGWGWSPSGSYYTQPGFWWSR